MAEITTHPEITIASLAGAVLPILTAGDVPFILSGPGIGKTETASAVAKHLSAKFVTLVASLMDRLDLGGLPRVKTKKFPAMDKPDGVEVAAWAPNELMASLSQELNPDGGPVLLYLNEFNAAPESTLPVFMRLLNERAIGDLTLRENVYLMADGNPASTNSCGHDLPEALKRRLRPLVVTTSVNDWTKWAAKEGLDGRIIAFISTTGFAKHLNDFDPKQPQRLTYSTPAGWARLSRANAVIETADDDVRRAQIAAFVGVEASCSFLGFLAHKGSLPDIPKVLAERSIDNLPTQPDVLGYLVGAIHEYVRSTPGTLGSAALLYKAMVTSSRAAFPEFGVLGIRMLVSNAKIASKLSKDEGWIELVRFVKDTPTLRTTLMIINQ